MKALQIALVSKRRPVKELAIFLVLSSCIREMRKSCCEGTGASLLTGSGLMLTLETIKLWSKEMNTRFGLRVEIKSFWSV
jgi:hypothetical protein